MFGRTQQDNSMNGKGGKRFAQMRSSRSARELQNVPNSLNLPNSANVANSVNLNLPNNFNVANSVNFHNPPTMWSTGPSMDEPASSPPAYAKNRMVDIRTYVDPGLNAPPSPVMEAGSYARHNFQGGTLQRATVEERGNMRYREMHDGDHKKKVRDFNSQITAHPPQLDRAKLQESNENFRRSASWLDVTCTRFAGPMEERTSYRMKGETVQVDSNGQIRSSATLFGIQGNGKNVDGARKGESTILNGINVRIPGRDTNINDAPLGPRFRTEGHRTEQHRTEQHRVETSQFNVHRFASPFHNKNEPVHIKNEPPRFEMTTRTDGPSGHGLSPPLPVSRTPRIVSPIATVVNRRRHSHTLSPRRGEDVPNVIDPSADTLPTPKIGAENKLTNMEMIRRPQITGSIGVFVPFMSRPENSCSSPRLHRSASAHQLTTRQVSGYRPSDEMGRHTLISVGLPPPFTDEERRVPLPQEPLTSVSRNLIEHLSPRSKGRLEQIDDLPLAIPASPFQDPRDQIAQGPFTSRYDRPIIPSAEYLTNEKSRSGSLTARIQSDRPIADDPMHAFKYNEFGNNQLPQRRDPKQENGGKIPGLNILQPTQIQIKERMERLKRLSKASIHLPENSVHKERRLSSSPVLQASPHHRTFTPHVQEPFHTDGTIPVRNISPSSPLSRDRVVTIDVAPQFLEKVEDYQVTMKQRTEPWKGVEDESPRRRQQRSVMSPSAPSPRVGRHSSPSLGLDRSPSSAIIFHARKSSPSGSPSPVINRMKPIQNENYIPRERSENKRKEKRESFKKDKSEEIDNIPFISPRYDERSQSRPRRSIRNGEKYAQVLKDMMSVIKTENLTSPTLQGNNVDNYSSTVPSTDQNMIVSAMVTRENISARGSPSTDQNVIVSVDISNETFDNEKQISSNEKQLPASIRLSKEEIARRMPELARRLKEIEQYQKKPLLTPFNSNLDLKSQEQLRSDRLKQPEMINLDLKLQEQLRSDRLKQPEIINITSDQGFNSLIRDSGYLSAEMSPKNAHNGPMTARHLDSRPQSDMLRDIKSARGYQQSNENPRLYEAPGLHMRAVEPRTHALESYPHDTSDTRTLENGGESIRTRDQLEIRPNDIRTYETIMEKKNSLRPKRDNGKRQSDIKPQSARVLLSDNRSTDGRIPDTRTQDMNSRFAQEQYQNQDPRLVNEGRGNRQDDAVQLPQATEGSKTSKDRSTRLRRQEREPMDQGSSRVEYRGPEPSLENISDGAIERSSKGKRRDEGPQSA